MAAMMKCIARRGPDANGIAKKGKCLFGHSRLAIIDIGRESNQPMQDATGRYTLVFNGEVYNYRELRSSLQETYRQTFGTQGDTEVLLYGLIHEGSNFLSRINGFFALAFYDELTDKLLLARDRFGIKPLYYARTDESFYFCSNLRGLAQKDMKREIDPQALFSYFQLSYIPAPATIFRNVYKLMPATFLEWTAGKERIEQFYHIAQDQDQVSLTDGEVLEKFKSLLEKSVEARLVSDVALGTFLSGGFDSSVIAMLASRQRAGLDAFTIEFPDNPYYNEGHSARKIAKFLGLKHHLIPVHTKDLDADLEIILDAIDEPFADSSAVLVHLLSQHTRGQVKVALSGDGADESMGGYFKHLALMRSTDSNMLNKVARSAWPIIRKWPGSRNNQLMNYLRQAKRYSSGLQMDISERYEYWASWTQPSRVNKLLKYGQKPQPLDLAISAQNFNSILRADMSLVLANDMLHKVDSMSMDCGLEVRVPFLDHELIDFLFSLPANHKVSKNSGKRILHNAYRKDFPAGLFNGKKKGFEAPLTHWFNGPLQSFRKRYLNREHINNQGIFNFEEVRTIEKEALSPFSGDAPHTLWALLVFQHWHMRFLEGTLHA